MQWRDGGRGQLDGNPGATADADILARCFDLDRALGWRGVARCSRLNAKPERHPLPRRPTCGQPPLSSRSVLGGVASVSTAGTETGTPCEGVAVAPGPLGSTELSDGPGSATAAGGSAGSGAAGGAGTGPGSMPRCLSAAK